MIFWIFTATIFFLLVLFVFAGPLVVVIHFRDGKLAHEHIYWDQASVLVQLGLLDPSRLPIAGVDTARKVMDPTRPSNELIRRTEAQASRRTG